MPEQIVSANEILAAAGADKPVKQGTFLQRTGLRLALGVGILGSVVILAVVGKALWSIALIPKLPVNTDSASVKAALENYRALQQIVLEPYTHSWIR